MPTSQQLPVKFAIVLIVFPTIAYVTTLVTGLALMLPMLLLPSSLFIPALPILKIVTNACGLAGGLLVSWKIWPREQCREPR